jgi:hypothetical protein
MPKLIGHCNNNLLSLNNIMNIKANITNSYIYKYLWPNCNIIWRQ